MKINKVNESEGLFDLTAPTTLCCCCCFFISCEDSHDEVAEKKVEKVER